MAINKNFVVKNGIEVNTNLIVADTDSNKVGIGTTIPAYTLHVFQGTGIGASTVEVTGIGTFLEELNVGFAGTTLTVLSNDSIAGTGGSVGVGTALPAYVLDVRSPVSTGQTALYVQGDVRITGDINIDDITINDLIVSGISTFQDDIFIGTGATVGFGSTAFFKDYAKAIFGNGEDLKVYHDGSNSYISDTGTGGLILGSNSLTVKNAALNETQAVFTENGSVALYHDNSKRFETNAIGVEVSGTFESTGITTLASDAGITTTGGDLYVGGDLYINEDVILDTNLTILGIATIGSINISGTSGINTIDSTVQSSSKDTGALVIEGGVGIEKNLFVGGGAEVTGLTTITGVLDANNTTQSSSSTTGAAQFAGGVGVAKNLYVGGGAEITGITSIDGVLNAKNTLQATSPTSGSLATLGGLAVVKNAYIGGGAEITGLTTITGVLDANNTTQSSSSTTGAAKFAGGVGIEKNLFVGGGVEITGITTITGNLEADGVVSIDDATQSSSTTTGALKVDGGAGIVKNLYVGGGAEVTGLTTITGVLDANNTTQSSSSTTGAAQFAGGMGIAKNLYVGGGAEVTGLTTITGVLDANNTTQSSSSTTGAAQFAGGVGVAKNLYVGGGQVTTGIHTITDLRVGTQLAGQTLVGITTILDEDNMASDSAAALATQQSIKAYVDAQVSGSDLDFAGDSGGAQSVDLDSQTFTIAGTSNEIETSSSGQTLTVGLPDDVTIGQDLTVTRNVSIASSVFHIGDLNSAFGFPAADTFTVYTAGSERLRIDSSGDVGIGEDSPDVRLHVKEQFDTAYSLANATDETNNLLKLENPSTTANAFAGIAFRTGSGADMYFGSIQQNVNDGDFYFANQNSTNKELLRIKSTGRVSIGEASDVDHTLCVAGTDDTTSLTGGHSQGIQLQNKSTTDGTYSQIEWRTSSGGRYARIAGIQDDANGNGGQLVFLTENSSGTTVEALRITSDGKLRVPDNGKFTCGAGDDLQLYADGTDSFIDNDEGDLYIRNTGDDIIIRAADDVLIQTQGSEGAIIARGDGTVELYYNNAKKFETTSSGVIATGINTAGAVRITDNLTPVTGQGLELFCPDTSSSTIQSFDRTNGETDKLTLRGNPVELKDSSTVRVTTNSSGVINTGITTFSSTSHIKIPVGTTAQRPSAAVAGDFRYNSTTGGFEGYTDEWGAIAGSGGGASESDTSVSSTSATSIYTTAHATNRSVSAIIQITQGTSYQVGRYLVIHNGTTATIVEESAVATGDMLGSFTADINSTNLRILVNMNSASSATVTILPTVVTV